MQQNNKKPESQRHKERVMFAIRGFMHSKKQRETALPASRKRKVWSGSSESRQGIFIG